MGKIIERIVDAQRMEDIISVFGSFDENIKRIEIGRASCRERV